MLMYNDINIQPNIKIYIHTWHIYSNSLSCIVIETDNLKNQNIYEYFKDFKDLIKHIIIDDDKNIKLIGNFDGKVEKLYLW